MRTALLSATALALLLASGTVAQDATTKPSPTTKSTPAAASTTTPKADPASTDAKPMASETAPMTADEAEEEAPMASDAEPMAADEEEEAAPMASDVAPMATDDADMATMGDTPEEVAPEVASSPDSGTVDRANPEMALVITKLMDLGAKPVHTLDVPAARTQPTPADAVKAVYLETTGKQPFPEPVAKTDDIKVAGAVGELDARVYWPAGVAEGDELPIIVYFHGGGWVIANLNVYDASGRALANQAKAVVVSVHYRQGPEDKFPAAHDDAIAAYSDIVERAAEWNADAERVAVAGESAGGNLALNVAIAARDQNLIEPDAILAVYPVAGSDLNTPSYIANQNAVPLGKADIEWFVGHYLNSMDEAKDPRIDIVGGADLNDLPPVTIIAAEIDPLNSEGMTLRDKLEDAGNDVTYQNWNGVTHEFFGMAAVVPEAKEAQNLAGTELKEAFSE